MDGSTSIGPAEASPPAEDKDASDEAIVEGVDALDANEFDMSRGLAGIETRLMRRKPGEDTATGAAPPAISPLSARR
jgi:hypothetical protein